MLQFMFFAPLAIFLTHWAYNAKGVIPDKYLTGAGPALGFKWAMLAGVLAFIQVVTVMMARVVTNNGDPLRSQGNRFIMVGNKSLRNLFEQTVLFTLNLTAFSCHAPAETVVLFSLIFVASRIVYWILYNVEMFTGFIGRTSVATGTLMSMFMGYQNLMWVLEN